MEYILSAGNIGIGDETAVSSLYPVLIEAFQLIGVLIFLRGLKVEGGKLQGDEILFVGKLDGYATGKVHAQGFVKDFKSRHCHARRDGVRPDVLGAEEIEAIDPANVYGPVPGAEVGIRVELVALQPIGRVVNSDHFCARIKLRQAVI